MGPGGVELTIGRRLGTETEFMWTVWRSTDMRTFAEILRIENGVATGASGVAVESRAASSTIRDGEVPAGKAAYRVEVQLAQP